MTAEEMKAQADSHQAKAREIRSKIIAQTSKMSALMQQFLQTGEVPEEFKDDAGFEDSDDELALPRDTGNLAFCALEPQKNTSSLEAATKVSIRSFV